MLPLRSASHLADFADELQVVVSSFLFRKDPLQECSSRRYLGYTVLLCHLLSTVPLNIAGEWRLLTLLHKRHFEGPGLRWKMKALVNINVA